MTQTATLTTSPRSLRLILAAPFAGFAKSLAKLVAANPRLQQAERLSATTDAQLATIGKTRASEIYRIFGPQMYI
ncbi:hypothetical protein GCM10010873_07470 [Cypionkella aquatica]|uniref:DUF1127 domain-containing protein n=1 Tax=Cypionkella aquatica TaxID=1756042 RepID=A0AA37WZ10_9RHOB|nr:DUF1127 domain-containing protein [Cypionkella aquatica]GLS85773.1 hypothetical protein GCM10010873_07470 [Cypionkella aquatica]